MNAASHFKCECQHCHGHLECPAEAVGQVVECPHCGKPTELHGPARPPKSSGVAKKIIVGSVVIIAVIAVSAIWSTRHAEETARLRQETEAAAQLTALLTAEAEAKAKDPLAQAGWKISAIHLEKKPGSTIIHAVGSLTNETERRRFGVKIKFDLFNTMEQKIGAPATINPPLNHMAVGSSPPSWWTLRPSPQKLPPSKNLRKLRHE